MDVCYVSVATIIISLEILHGLFNKVILTYFTPLSSCGNSLTLLKRRNIDCNFIKIASINQVLGGSESVMRYVYDTAAKRTAQEQKIQHPVSFLFPV